MNITINGNQKAIEPHLNLLELIEHHNLNKDAVVIEINRNIIQKNDFAATHLKENDIIEIVSFVGGG